MRRPFVRLLGAPVLQLEHGEDVALAAERRNQMLVYLGCRRRWVTRDELATLLWPERDQAAARSNLRNVVMQIRRARIDGIDARGETLRWSIASDLETFETTLAARDWRAALAAYGGPLLDGFEANAPPAFADWLRFERARLEGLWRDALAARLDELAADPAACATLAQQVLQADPLNETALAAVLRAQAAPGAANAAQRAWHTYVARLADEHGIEPSTELRALARPVQANAPPRAAPVALAAACIGRRLELAQAHQLLGDPGCRLLTLSGPGGVGKSTLARAAVPGLAAQFSDGVAWIALEDLTRIDEIAPRIAARIGLQLSGAGAPDALLAQHLRGRQALLVCDNAEHLAGFDRFAETLLRECASLKLIVTSRARIGVAGEWLLPLDGLPVPDRDEGDIEVLRAFDAVKLFEQRAGALSPGFDLAAQAADVVALAHAVEGLPLALELAAAWSRLLPVREIVRELERSLDVLALPGNAAARDRSLRASFEHSWRLLAPVEREVLPRLAVFAGGFARAAAAEVARAPLPVLAALVDKSLVRASGDGRFSLHPLLRQCALEKLDDDGRTRRAFADHYAQLLAHIAVRTDSRSALDDTELDLPNFLAAWRCAVDARHASVVQAMAAGLASFFDQRGRPAEGIELMQAAATAFGDTASGRARAHIDWKLSNLLVRCGRPGEGERAARAALRALAAARDRRSIAGCLCTLGVALHHMGRRDAARECYERGLRRARADGDDTHVDRLEVNLAITEETLGHYERALELFRRSLGREHASGASAGQVSTRNNIGELLRVMGRPAEAAPFLEDGLRRCRAIGYEQAEPFLLFNLAWTRLDLGALDDAVRLAEQALELARTRGTRSIEVAAPVLAARIETRRGRQGRAFEHLRQSLALAREGAHVVWQFEALGQYAATAAAAGDRLRAATYWHFLAAEPRVQAVDRADALAAIERLQAPDAEATAARQAGARLTLETAVETILAEASPAG